MIVLDTHVLIWWIEDRGRLSARAAAAIDEQAPALVSPISFWELAVLVNRGRVSVDRAINRWCRDLLASDMVGVAALTPTVALSAAQLLEFHGDPADRFIYATAIELNVPLVSRDEKIRKYALQTRSVDVIW